MTHQRQHSHSYSFVLIALSTLSVTTVPASAQDLLGAQGAIEQVRKKGAVSTTPAKKGAELRKTIKALPKKLETLAPAEAASAWLAVYDEWLANSMEIRAGLQQLQFSELIDVLPSPAAWPDLARRIEARPVAGSDEIQMRSLALRMLGHRLTNQTELLKQDVEQALKLVGVPKKQGENEGGQEAELGEEVQDPDGLAAWKQQLQSEVAIVKQEFDPLSAVEQFRKELESFDSARGGSLNVPDLVRLIGPEAATPLLERALLHKDLYLQFDSRRGPDSLENETVKLARELARKHLKELPHPHWELCHSTDAIDLFEAFTAMPKPENSPFGYVDHSAITAYIAGLIVRDRPKDLIKYLTELPRKENGSLSSQVVMSLGSSIVPQLERAGHTRKAHAFLAEALKTHPELPLWDIFIELSARLGQSPEALALLDSALDRKALAPTKRQGLQQVRADALLATDRIEDGVAQSLKLAAEDKGDDVTWQGRSRLELALRVAEIGRLQERDEWIRQGTDIAEKILAEKSQGESTADLVGLLIELGQLARAERLIIGDLATKMANEDPASRLHSSLSFGNNSSLEQLLQVYHKAGRAADVVTLLEEAPWWQQTDVSGFLAETSPFHGRHGERAKVPTPLIAARALAAVGRKDEARRIATAMVTKWPSFDPGWQLALELTGDEFAPLAERVFARDRFEERPLIWLAKFHLDRGNVAKGEELARQAIAIDPSDGEQGRGDRMRVYAVLAEILRKRGDAKTAATYEGAVKAIRLAERADQFHHAGMLSRGIRMYRESLTYFADAYCIQSRLAVQLAQAGDLEGASAHYKRAFELMPESFGRVESHCFGCEGVFGGQVAEQIAEQVFQKLVAAQPNNPRVHYLLGYLRMSESRDADAVKSFREAVRLDPDYLNAWQLLLGSSDTALTAEERDQATFQVLRLDPLGLHVSAGVPTGSAGIDISGVQDLARLWTVLQERARLGAADRPSPLFELTAAKQDRTEAETKLREVGMGEEQFTQDLDGRQGLSAHNSLNAIATMIQSAER